MYYFAFPLKYDTFFKESQEIVNNKSFKMKSRNTGGAESCLWTLMQI